MADQIIAAKLIENLLRCLKNISSGSTPFTLNILSKKIKTFIEGFTEKALKGPKSSETFSPVDVNESAGAKAAEDARMYSLALKNTERVRAVCHFVWQLIEIKREDWTRIILSRDGQFAQLSLAYTHLDRLCRLLHELLDTMDAVFQDSPAENVSLDQCRGAKLFTDVLANFPAALAPDDKKILNVDTQLDLRDFRSFICQDCNRELFEQAGNHLQALIMAVKHDLKRYSIVPVTTI